MAKLKFGATKEGMTSTNVARLETPYLGQATLARIGSTTIEGQNEQQYDVLEFDFKLAGLPADNPLGLPEVKAGIHLIHTEWQPKGLDPDTAADDGREPDSLEKVENEINRIGYILKYFFGEKLAETVTQVEGDTYPEIWASLLKRVDAVVKQKAAELGIYDKVVEVKAVGEVYQGNGRVDFTNYIGFLADPESGEALTFGKGERRRNREYLAWHAAQNGAAAGSSDDFDIPDDAPGADDAPSTDGDDDVIF